MTNPQGDTANARARKVLYEPKLSAHHLHPRSFFNWLLSKDTQQKKQDFARRSKSFANFDRNGFVWISNKLYMGNEPNTMSNADETSKSVWPNRIKAACFVTTAGFFGLGLRAAYNQARPLDPQDLTKMKLLSGVGFASKALGIATLLTASGFSLFVIGISALLDVNTPRQFGVKMRNAFGDKYKIAGSGSGESYESLSELFEVAGKRTIEKKEEAH